MSTGVKTEPNNDIMTHMLMLDIIFQVTFFCDFLDTIKRNLVNNKTHLGTPKILNSIKLPLFLLKMEKVQLRKQLVVHYCEKKINWLNLIPLQNFDKIL